MNHSHLNNNVNLDDQSIVDSQLEPEGTVHRKVSDNVALPMSDHLNKSNVAVQEHRDSIPESPALPDSPGFNHIAEQNQQQKQNYIDRLPRHRKSFHMTPSGYMGQKFIPKKHKKSVTTDAIPSMFNLHKNNKKLQEEEEEKETNLNAQCG